MALMFLFFIFFHFSSMPDPDPASISSPHYLDLCLCICLSSDQVPRLARPSAVDTGHAKRLSFALLPRQGPLLGIPPSVDFELVHVCLLFLEHHDASLFLFLFCVSFFLLFFIPPSSMRDFPFLKPLPQVVAY